jgi:large repetitive protein
MRLHQPSAHLLLCLLPLVGVGLLPLRGEAAGGALVAPCATPPELVKDIASGGGDSGVSELVSVGGTLFFSANDGSSGAELWRSDGTPTGTRLVKDLRVGPEGSSPERLTRVGEALFFMASFPNSTELWRSDGTEAGTVRVRGFPPQLLSTELIAVGSTLFLVVDDGSSGFELWRSDGTEAGTVRVKDLWPGSGSSLPEELTVFKGVLFFRANDGTSGVELWRSDGTEAGTVRVKDAAPGGNSGYPAELTVVGQTLFFTANLGSGNAKLWKSDGTEAGTVRLKDIQPGAFGSAPHQLTAVGRTLFFVANDGVSGNELWRSDGTAVGTRRVRDIASREGNPAFSVLSPGPGLLLLAMSDGSSGTELWRSDGTEAGTYPLADLVEGAGSSSPRALTILGTRLFFVARTTASGEELFSLPLSGLDCTPPTLVCPADQRLEASSPAGSDFAFPRAVASDDSLSALTVSYSRPSDIPFLLGETVVQATAQDEAGNVAQCSFRVTVRDTTAPLIQRCPTQGLVMEATAPEGAIVSYFVVVSDLVSTPVVEYSPPSGSLFPIGETPVTISARDAAGNLSRCLFTVAVQDTQAPRLTCPKDRSLTVWSEEDLSIHYPIAVQDAASHPQVSATPAPGSVFPLGETIVTLTARDEAGNASQCTFRVHLVDPVGPTIACPELVQAVASTAEGAVVEFPEAVATDNLGPPEVSYSHAPGSTFAVGETVVTATARDRGGATASCTFTVTVVEAPPRSPELSCQAGASSVGLGWLLLALIPLWGRRRAS